MLELCWPLCLRIGQVDIEAADDLSMCSLSKSLVGRAYQVTNLKAVYSANNSSAIRPLFSTSFYEIILCCSEFLNIFSDFLCFYLSGFSYLLVRFFDPLIRPPSIPTDSHRLSSILNYCLQLYLIKVITDPLKILKIIRSGEEKLQKS